MKTWNEPSIEELMINETAGGGPAWMQSDGQVRHIEGEGDWDGHRKPSGL